MAKTIRLRVRNTLTSPGLADLPKVQLSRNTMTRAELVEGDLVELRAGRLCGGIASHSFVVDDGSVRLPGFLQRNAGVAEGGCVSLRKANLPEAQVVVLSGSPGWGEEIKDYLRARLSGLPVNEGDILPVRSTFRSILFTNVVSVEPRRLARVGQKTILTLKSVPKQPKAEVVRISSSTSLGSPLLDVRLGLGIRTLAPAPEAPPKPSEPLQIDLRETMPPVRYDEIGGLSEQIGQVREMVELPLLHPEVFKHFGIRAPRGVLFIGPPGTGKTMLARAVASSVNANVFTVKGPEVVTKWYGEPEARLREVFSNAANAAPSIIIFDEIDSIAPKRSKGEGREVERRIVSTLLTMMDGLGDRGDVIVIGTTNDPDSIDPAIRRPGRFDRELVFPVPNAGGRHEIFKIHTRNMPLARDVDLVKLAERTHGMSGADIAAVCREAALSNIRRHMSRLEKSPESLATLLVEDEDFREILEKMGPSTLRGWLTFTAKTRGDDIGGLQEVKRRLLESVILPTKEPERYKQMGVEPVKGVILYGPSGNGKTMLCRWVASEIESNTILVNSTEMMSKYVGESETNIRSAFEAARGSPPCILIFDEIDAICPRRSGDLDTGVANRVVSTFLMEMDGLRPLSNVTVIGTTNRMDMMDPALLRPGRFDLKIEVPPPDEEARLQIFGISAARIPLSKDVDLRNLSKVTEGFSGADINGLCREAALNALRAGKTEVSAVDFEEALGLRGGKARTEGRGQIYP